MRLSLAMIIILASYAWAQQVPEPKPTSQPTTPVVASQAGENVSYSWRLGQYDVEARRFVAHGNINLSWKNTTLRCDSVVLWPAEKTAEDEENKDGDAVDAIKVRSLYAEGTVVVTMIEQEFVFRCDRLYLDLISKQGVFLDAVVRKDVNGRDRPIPLTFRAEEMRQFDANRFELLNVDASTSASLDPSYRITSPRMMLEVEGSPLSSRRVEKSRRNIRYELDSSVLYAGDFPIFATPAFSGNTNDEFGYSYFRGASVDNSRQFGPSARLTFGTPIAIDDRPWGDINVPVQYLGDRGFGGGVDLRYGDDEQWGYRGQLLGFYQRDRGSDELFGTPPDPDRGRVTLRHRHFLPEKIQLDIEFSKISDRGFLPEYREREFKAGKDQETLIYAKRANGSQALTFLASVQLNNFDTQNEFLPQVGYNLFSYPIIEFDDELALYFDADYEVSHVARRFDGALGLVDRRTTRVDLDNVISLPFFAGPIKFEPFAGFRYSHYDQGRFTPDSLNRFGTTFGLKASTQLSRTFDVAGGLFNLNGLRHIILPEIEYRRIHDVSHQAQDFIFFDGIDTFSERETIRFGVRNRLQTLWEIEGESQVVEFLDLDVEWTLFTHPDRDNFGEAAGNLDIDFLLKFSPDLVYLMDFEYSFLLDDMEVLNSTLGWNVNRNLSLGLGYRRYAGFNDVIIGVVQWRASERLGIAIRSGYDFEDNNAQDMQLEVQRIGEDWVFEFELDFDNQGGIGFGISFTPRALFDPRQRFGEIRSEPRFGGFGRGLLR